MQSEDKAKMVAGYCVLCAKRDSMLSVRISKETHDVIGKLAKAQDTSIADMITMWATDAAWEEELLNAE